MILKNMKISKSKFSQQRKRGEDLEDATRFKHIFAYNSFCGEVSLRLPGDILIAFGNLKAERYIDSYYDLIQLHRRNPSCYLAANSGDYELLVYE